MAGEKQSPAFWPIELEGRDPAESLEYLRLRLNREFRRIYSEMLAERLREIDEATG